MAKNKDGSKRASPPLESYDHYSVDEDGVEYCFNRPNYEEHLVKITFEFSPELLSQFIGDSGDGTAES